MKQNTAKTLCVIGGGASGLACAIEAARCGFAVTILEHTDRIGKKILMTGNGKCNFTNRLMNEEQYYTDEIPFLRKVLAQFGTDELLAFFDSLHLCYKEKNGYFYPVSNQAASVLDVLRFELLKRDVQIVTSTVVTDILEKGDYTEVYTKNQTYVFDVVVLACGGKAYAVTGSDGSGYQLCKKLGLKQNPPSEALVALKSSETYFKAVAGVRTDAEVSVWVDGQCMGTEMGELQITDYGISGIPVFQLSRIVSVTLLHNANASVYAQVDLFPALSKQALLQHMQERIRENAMLQIQDALSGFLNKKLNTLMLKHAHVSPAMQAGDIKVQSIHQMVQFCKKWHIPITGTNDFSKCQVCAGGVWLSELTQGFACKKHPNVYVIGELTDVDGKCGGYNLHYAFASGILAARDAARRHI